MSINEPNHVQKWPIVEMLQLTLFWKNNIFYKFHCWFLGEKCTLKNISKNFATHKNLFLWWWPRAKVLKNWNLSTSSVHKWNNHVQKWPIVEMLQLTLFWKNNIFYKFHCWFWGEKCTLKNISKNFGTHKKPFSMVMTTSKSFKKTEI